jgi:hypothetical protein
MARSIINLGMKMETQIKLLTVVPFGGFYESIASHLLDREVKDLIEYSEEEESRDYISAPINYDDVAVNYKGYTLEYSKQYTALYDQAFSGELSIELGLIFESLENPKFYNYETDRIFATLPLQNIQKVLDSVDGVKLAGFILERFTSRSGFSSFYSNDLTDWINKPLKDWDHNEVNTLLEFALSGQAMTDYELDGLYELPAQYVEVKPALLTA